MTREKKLLILGGVAQLEDIVRDAQSKGYYVYVVDNCAASPAKQYANEAVDISIVDSDAIARFCKDNKITSVMNYCLHPGQRPYYQICMALGVDPYGSEEQFESLIQKTLFKAICVRNKIPIAQEYDHDELLDPSFIDWPVVVKPVDGRASKGVSLCYNIDNVNSAIINAAQNCAQRSYIIEKFNCGQEFIVKYFVIDGVIALTSMSDVFVLYSGNKRIYYWSQVFPSIHYSLYLASMDHRIRDLIKGLGIKNGPLSFTGFTDGINFQFIDPSFRLGGAQDWLIVNAITGVNISSLMTEYAINGSMGNASIIKSLDKKFSKKASAMLYFLVRSGKIDKIKGVDQALRSDCVVAFHQCHDEGDIVQAEGSSQHVILRFLMVATSFSALKNEMRKIQECIEVLDVYCNSMLLKPFDIDILNAYEEKYSFCQSN